MSDRQTLGGIGPPTAEDLARDAAADLAVCDAAEPGPYLLEGAEGSHAGVKVPSGMIWAMVHNPDTDDIVDARLMAILRLFTLSRDAMPAWIRRCAQAERQVMDYQSDPAYDRQRDIGAAQAAEYLLRELRGERSGGVLSPGPLADAVAGVRALLAERDRYEAALHRIDAGCGLDEPQSGRIAMLALQGEDLPS